MNGRSPTLQAASAAGPDCGGGEGVGLSVRGRVLTDHRIPELPWWSQQLTILRPPTGSGLPASLEVAVRTIWTAPKFDGFISANVRNALALGFLKRCLSRRGPRLVMTELRLDDPRPGARWRLKVAVQRFAYAAADALCVSSRREAETYAERLGIPLSRFRFVPWHTNVLAPRLHDEAGEYFFAAGRTGRDWPTLARAVEGLPVPVTVVCATEDARHVGFPGNVTVLTDIPYERYRQLLEGARAVIVPLEPHSFSSGQVVVLEAMALGKPVIATRVLGTEDYISHERDGLFVDAEDAAGLRQAVERIASDPALARRMGQEAVTKVLNEHTLERYARRLVEIMNEQLSPSRSPHAAGRAVADRGDG